MEAYGFSTIDTIMFWGAIASFILAAIMSVLVSLGLWHARRTAPETQLLRSEPKAIPAS